MPLTRASFGYLPFIAGGLLLACGDGRNDGEAGIDTALSPPVWRTGGETTDFGSNDPPACMTEREPITVAEATERGFTPDADLALMEGEHEASLRWSDQSAPTTVHVSARLASLSLIRSTKAPFFELEDGFMCEDDLEYRFAIDLATDDGSIQGSFETETRADFGRANLSPEPPVWNVGRTLKALGDFQGTRTLFVDPARPQWIELSVALRLGARFSGLLSATVYYTDGRTPELEDALPIGEWSDQAAPGVTEWRAPAGSEPVALDDHASSVPLPSFDVWLNAWSEAPEAVLDVTIDGRPTQLTDVPTGLPAPYLDLGRLHPGAVVSANLSSPVDATGLYVRVGGCVGAIGERSADGNWRLETTVEPQRCDPDALE